MGAGTAACRFSKQEDGSLCLGHCPLKGHSGEPWRWPRCLSSSLLFTPVGTICLFACKGSSCRAFLQSFHPLEPEDCFCQSMPTTCPAGRDHIRHLTTHTVICCKGLPHWRHAAHCKKTPPSINTAQGKVPPQKNTTRTLNLELSSPVLTITGLWSQGHRMIQSATTQITCIWNCFVNLWIYF